MTYDLDENYLAIGTGNVTSHIESVEKVIVPAGTFEDCLKLSVLVSAQYPLGKQDVEYNQSNIHSTQWNARNVGMVKQNLTNYVSMPEMVDSEIHTTFELTD